MADRTPIRTLLQRSLSRRALLQAGQVASLAAGVGGLWWMGRSEAETTQTGTCRICTMHCGLVATRRGSRLVRVEGDPAAKSRGFLCHHGYALREIIHSSERLSRPLKRRGRDFEELSWSEALAEIAGRLQEVKAAHGARAFAVQTGWPFVRHPLIPVLHRFTRAFGTPNLATCASLCEAAGRMGRTLVAGANLHVDEVRPKTLLVWGANPTVSAPLLAHVVEGMAFGERKLIVVDPMRTALAEKATLHLQPRPGSDGALALGMLHVLFSEQLFDRARAVRETVGLEALEALARGYPPERASALTSVPQEKLVAAARLFAREGPGATWTGLGLEHQDNGVQTVRAVVSLSAVLGYVDVPGGERLDRRAGVGFDDEPLPALYRLATPEPVPPPVAELPIGYGEHPLYEVFNRQAQAMLFPKAILEGAPYPLRAMLFLGANPLLTSPDSSLWRRAAEKLELMVTVDPFLSETAARSDFVLPAATFAEAATVGPGVEDAVARSSLVPVQNESWPDWKVVFELARALGLSAYFPWSSFQEALDAPRVPFMLDASHTPRPTRQRSPEPPRYPTQSGKLELESALLRHFGHPPLPEWLPPGESPSAQSGFPLWLVTGARTRPYINSQFRQIPSIASKLPEPFASVHPEVAAQLGLADGEWIQLVTRRGRVRMRVRLTDRVHREVVSIPAGFALANANELTPADRLDPISGFPALRSCCCRLERDG